MTDEVLNEAGTTANRPRRGMIAGLIENLFDAYKDQFSLLLRRQLSEELARSGSIVADAVRVALTDIVRAEAKRVIDEVRLVDYEHHHNIQHAGHILALREAADFVQQNMPKAQAFGHPHDTLRHALSLAPTGGMALEFGVSSGTTLKIIADSRQGLGPVYGFDSFEGLPEKWRVGVEKGAFAKNELPQVDGAELVVGWFNETLPGFVASHEGVVDFLHVDCDIYSSTKTVFDLVGSRLRPGSVVLFDEYFNYPSWQQHEHKAWNEFLQRTGMRCSYEAFTVDHEQVMVRIIA